MKYSYNDKKFQSENEALKDKLHKIDQWCKAYPVDIFPEMTKEDWKKANYILERSGLVLRRITSSNFRRVLKGVEGIVNEK